MSLKPFSIINYREILLDKMGESVGHLSLQHLAGNIVMLLLHVLFPGLQFRRVSAGGLGGFHQPILLASNKVPNIGAATNCDNFCGIMFI